MVAKHKSQLETAVFLVLMSIVVYYLVDIVMTFPSIPDAVRRGMPTKSLQALAAHKNVSCFILTLNESLEAVLLQEGIVCHPFLGQITDPFIFSHVDAQIQLDLVRGRSSRGAHYTNNQSVSIAWNHMRLWQKLSLSDDSEDMLIFEDDAIITNHSLNVYRELQKLNTFKDNYIIKLVNHHGLWLGRSELSSLERIWVDGTSYVLKKCVCRTRQNYYNTGAYVIDRHAAQILLDKFLPMRFHVDMYLHYTGCEFSNLFVVESDVVQLSDRLSTHQSVLEKINRMWPDLKELFMNIVSSDC